MNNFLCVPNSISVSLKKLLIAPKCSWRNFGMLSFSWIEMKGINKRYLQHQVGMLIYLNTNLRECYFRQWQKLPLYYSSSAMTLKQDALGFNSQYGHKLQTLWFLSNLRFGVSDLRRMAEQPYYPMWCCVTSSSDCFY